jgi:hypothetical protein
MRAKIVIYELSAGRRCSRMSAFFKARATKERVPLINARMNGRCLHASGSYNIFCTKIKLFFFCFNTLSLFDTMLNFVENLLENERDPRSDQ